MTQSNSENYFKGEIRVAATIIDDLSSGLYHTPAACLKELINNSYDAGATHMDVFVKPDADRIIIADNGSGMNKKEFETHFQRVSESHKRDVSDKTESGRPKIGKIGIGFIAANELCEVMEIYSTKAGSRELLHVQIDFSAMRRPFQERRRINDANSIVKADYEGELLQAEQEEHYTQIFLTSVRGEAKRIMAGAVSQNENSSLRSLYGLKSETIAERLKDPSLKTWRDLDAYSETMLQIGLNVPVAYNKGWLPEPYPPEVAELERHTIKLDFHVNYDGSDLKKPIVFNPPGGTMIVTPFQHSGEHVSANGYFYAQSSTIRPAELQGLLVRIRNAAVGEYDHNFWGFSQSDSTLIQRWISAEIWADDRLEDAMNIDRRTLRVAHPAYVELQKALHKALRSVLNQATTNIYKVGRDERKQQRTSETRNAIVGIAQDIIAPLSPNVASSLERLVDEADTKSASRKITELKFSLAELYDAVVNASKNLLDDEQVDELLKRLTKQLGIK